MVQHWVVYIYILLYLVGLYQQACHTWWVKTLLNGRFMIGFATIPQQAYTTLVHAHSWQKGIGQNVMVCIAVISKRREVKVDKLRETTSS